MADIKHPDQRAQTEANKLNLCLPCAKAIMA
jgi:hypothetical protein